MIHMNRIARVDLRWNQTAKQLLSPVICRACHGKPIVQLEQPRNWFSEPILYKYSRIIIFDAPEDLPEGRYTLTFDGQRFPVQKAWQAWITVVLGA